MKIEMWVEANATEVIKIPDSDVDPDDPKSIEEQCWAHVEHFADQNTHSGFKIIEEPKKRAE